MCVGGFLMIPFLLRCVQSEAVCSVPGMELLSHQGIGCAAQVLSSMLNAGGPELPLLAGPAAQ